ncbi:MAG: Asp-tRNA(Asn)/Glu-tRNA(Gln) amidotransferase subunit GatA [Pseudomonadota bacterium]|nr:Asp-tRNA(Asn)/Glu-tRNA(Gln) amidotransferase subunit GatA [Pseudomonadota bacterium]
MPHRQSLSSLRKMLQTKKISSVELTSHFLQRIDQNRELNAFITVDAETALASARQADISLNKKSGDLLTGLPLALKDIFCTRGMLTSCGSRMLANFTSPYDATVTERLNAAGTVLLGKTNMDEFAMGSSNESSYFGPVLNPWNTDCVPGGSSGGSAAAVSARLCPATVGTDTGGSIRQPAAFCGLTGLKPSYGRVSRYGMVAFASSLDQAGPITQSAEDAALLLQAMAGFDPRDSTSLDIEVPDFLPALKTSLDGVTVGVAASFLDSTLDPDVLAGIEEALRTFENLGARLVDIELPNSSAGIPCYYVIALAEASSNLSRFDGVRYGHRAEQYDDLMDMYEQSRAEGFGDEVKRRILIGTYALSAGYYDAYYLKAQKIRRIIADDFRNAFQRCDLIVGPTTPTTAFRLGEKADDPVAMYLNDIFTVPVNLAGLPAVSIPVGLDQAAMPIGMQLIGPYLEESRILAAAHSYQQVTTWHQRVPEAFT